VTRADLALTIDPTDAAVSRRRSLRGSRCRTCCARTMRSRRDHSRCDAGAGNLAPTRTRESASPRRRWPPRCPRPAARDRSTGLAGRTVRCTCLQDRPRRRGDERLRLPRAQREPSRLLRRLASERDLPTERDRRARHAHSDGDHSFIDEASMDHLFPLPVRCATRAGRVPRGRGAIHEALEPGEQAIRHAADMSETPAHRAEMALPSRIGRRQSSSTPRSPALADQCTGISRGLSGLRPGIRGISIWSMPLSNFASILDASASSGSTN
jgi:hypothetical protein